MPRLAMPALLAAALLSAGCAAPQAGRPAPAPGPALAARAGAPAPNGRWEVVFPGAHISREVAGGGESSRLDAALAARTPANVIEESTWPPESAPSLDDLRSRFISDDPRSIHFYSAYGAAYTWWGSRWRWR